FGRWGRRLHELAHGIDEHAVQPERPTLQISAEDTFEHDLKLDELEPHIRRLADKAWAGYQREHERVARTVVLKLKTADFRTLTRSLTPPTRPPSPARCANGSSDRQTVSIDWSAWAWPASWTATVTGHKRICSTRHKS